ncbi:MAG: hypothetical protein ACFFEN_10810 [Candidatus Thorarchaeota archaeon]
MVKTKLIVALLILFSIIGIIHSIILSSFNVFITWLLIGIWLIFSFKVLQNIKQYREYNSPHNTAFFTVFPVFISIFYSIWGNFTGLLGENLLKDTNLYLSWWGIIFALPYLIYGSISLYRCFKKYNVIYFGTKSVDARKFGYILGFSILFFITVYWVSFNMLIDFYETLLFPVHFLIDLNLLILIITTIAIIIIAGFFGTRRRLTQLTRDYITQRTNRLNQLSSPNLNLNPRRYRKSIRTTTRSTPTPSSRSITTRSRSINHSSRTTPTASRQSTTTKSEAVTRTVSMGPKGKQVRKKSTLKITNFNVYKPKGARLTREDFKCIFCFKLPKFPEDKGRGIILCPNCRYPAHADEFKDWLQSSNLCSRCNAPIPNNYRKNPRTLSIKKYLLVVRHFTGNKK